MYSHFERHDQGPGQEHRRGHRHHPDPRFGPGPFGRHGGFGPGGPGGRGHGRGHGRGRAQRGDVRTAALLLLAEQPMHGYQLMQAITERTGGAWRPSPGAIYPTLNQLQDEGLVSTTSDGGRKLATLTDAGRQYLEEQGDSLPDPFAEFAGQADSVMDLRKPLEDLVSATRQLVRSGSEDQLTAAKKLLTETRRSLYLILAEDPGALGSEES